MPSKQLKVSDSFNSQAESKTAIKTKRPAPYSLRLSDTERTYLKGKAGKLSVHAYIRGLCKLSEASEAVLVQERKFGRHMFEEVSNACVFYGLHCSIPSSISSRGKLTPQIFTLFLRSRKTSKKSVIDSSLRETTVLSCCSKSGRLALFGV